MTKTNIILGLIVLALGLVAGAMVLAPNLVNDLTREPAPVVAGVQKTVASVRAGDRQAPEQPPVPLVQTPEAEQRHKPAAGPEQPPRVAEIGSDFNMVGADITVKNEDFDDWRVECASPRDGKAVCSMFQRLTWEENKAVEALRVVVAMTEREGKPIPRMNLIVPLGAFLPAGVSVALEDEKEIRVQIPFCGPEGCIVMMDLADDVIEQLKAKSKMTVGYFLPDQKAMRITVSLKGFTGALKRVQEQK